LVAARVVVGAISSTACVSVSVVCGGIVSHRTSAFSETCVPVAMFGLSCADQLT
jgi:hypothetical protein